MRLTPVVTETVLIVGLLLAGATASSAAPPPEPTPEPGPVEFDFDTNVGFVNESDIRQGFDWDAATLAANAGRVAFQQEKLVQDVYSVTCGRTGPATHRVVHTRQGARFFLIGAAVSGTPFSGTPTPEPAPAESLLGFRLLGSRAAISSTTVAPLPGTPCPVGGPGTDVSTSRVVSTTVMRSLVASFGDRDTTLLSVTTGPPTND